MKYSASLNLNIHNRGNEPTFMTHNRNEVIDLTLGRNLVNVMYIQSAPSVTSQTHMIPNRWHRTSVTVWGHMGVSLESYKYNGKY
jgi:hypothetical protein